MTAYSATSNSGFSGTLSSGDSLTVFNGATVDDIVVPAGATMTVSSGGIADATTISSGGSATVLGSGAIDSGTIILAGGVELVSSGGTTSGTTVYSGGIEDIVGKGSAQGLATELVLNGGGEIELGSYHSAQLDGLIFNSATDVLSVTSAGAVLDAIQLSGSYVASSFVLGAGSGTALTVTYTCYCGGTEILAENGSVPVEDIKAGEKVVVRRNGQDALESVIWVGKSKIDLSRHAHPELAAPIRVKAGALADNAPTRDLLLSPEHCLIINERCIPVKLLVNGGSIVREYRNETFEYYHIELEKHGILIAEGVEAESYLDTGNRSLFDNAGMPRMLHPAFDVNATSERWQTDACAPLASVPDEVSPVWQMLANRSAGLGYKVPTPVTVADPDLHILADGQRIQAVSDRDSRFVFTVPAGTKSVVLGSRFCIPADKMIPNQRDTRRLGVSVSWIAIRANGNETIFAADHPALRDGWNDAEHAGSMMWRWTNGTATIPWDNVAGSAIVTVCCTPVDQYPVYDEKLALVA